MKTIIQNTLVFSLTLLFSTAAFSGPIDPECNAKKAAKSTAMKATVGVGGRCKPAEAAKDTVGLDDKKGKKGKKGKKDKDGLLSKDDSENSKDKKNSKKKMKDDKDGFGLKKKAVKTVL
ncbi:MAG: hypothetical protein U9N50_01760 [Pseudomonadota bacterium]|nr:hypothetical protein [Pseudomonadota bacterium]